MAPRFARLAAAAVLQLGAVVLAHQLIYLARYGSRFGEALIHSGHGDAWSAALVSSVVLGLAAAALAGARLAWLAIQLRGIGSSRAVGRQLPRGDLVRGWLRLAPRFALITLVVLTCQENLEHASIGLAMPGPTILLTPEYAGGAWIAIAVALGAGLVAALFGWRERALLARLRAARAALPRRGQPVRRPAPRPIRPNQSLLGRRSALRAPPVPVAI